MSELLIAYKSYRLYMTKSASNGDGYFAISEWRMWEEASVLGTNILQGGTITASHTNAGYVAANAVDGNAETTWESTSVTGPKWIRYDMPAAKVVRTILLQHKNWPGEAPADFLLQGSNDGGQTWITVKAFVNFLTGNNAAAGRAYSFTINAIAGVAKLSDGRPCNRVLVHDWASGRFLGYVIPDPTGKWSFLADVGDDMLITCIGPNGYRPASDGPITPSFI
ncbi:discoidin domain-containing protein [Stenotrophomonas maltophilia]|uniref:Discoidin domain-containing protein n=1 Tax=Stenotrophomonas maltophilia TaxID=40324 RepID=A0ABD7C073_STEMA|nr:discoidin domain-containing protein [Stenotrophomonas maltophilia]QQQ41286.1 discoidin domain-containing protein [Stenotrophomonas maltophilia]